MDGVLTPFDTGPPLEVSQATPGDSIGVVEVANGNTFITRTDGAKVAAKVGDAIFQGDTIETDADGAIGILFSDDSVFSLAEEGQMVIDEMIYDPGTQDGSASFNIAAGVFTFVSGQIAKTGVDAMVVTTPSATIGIRGTAGAVRIGKDGPDSYTLLEEGGNNPAAIQGQAAGDTLLAQAPGGGAQLGEMLITNSVGSLSLSQAFQTTQISGPFSPPSPPFIMPAFAVQQAYASASAFLPPPPGINPQNNNQNAGTNDSGNPQGPADGGPNDGANADGETPSEEAEIEAQIAAADAFEEALAGGASLEEALVAAAGASAESRIGSALAADPEVFGTAGSIESVMGAVLNASLGGFGTEAGDPLDAGRGNDGAIDEAREEIEQVIDDIIDEINEDALDNAQDSAEEIMGEMIADGLLSAEILIVSQAYYESQHGSDLFDLGGENSDAFLDGGFEGGFGGDDPFDGSDDFFDPINDDFFDDLFKDPPEEDDIFLPPTSGNPTVTTFTDELIANSFTFVPNQNDILINDTSDNNTSVSLFGGAEAGDFYQGGSYNDTLVFSTDISQSLKVSDVTTINLSVFTTGSLIDLFFSGDSTTSINTGPSGYGGDVLISDSAGDNQNWTLLGGVDGSQNFMTILGGGGTDTVTLGSGTTNDISLSGVETVDMGDTSLKLKNEQSGTTIDAVAGSHLTLDGFGNSISLAGNAVVSTLIGSAGTDTITFDASGGTLENVEGVEEVFGDIGIDTITITDAIGTFINSAGGDDTVNGGAGDDTILTKSGSDTVDAGAGDDTITGGNGADTMTGGAGNDTFIYTFKNHFGDTISDFVAGSGNDIFNIGTSISPTSGTGFQSVAMGGTLSSGTGIFAYTTDISLSGTEATDKGTIIAEFGGQLTASNLTNTTSYFAIGDSTNSSLWHWDDTSAGGGTVNGIVESAEIELVAYLDTTDTDLLDTANFVLG